MEFYFFTLDLIFINLCSSLHRERTKEEESIN